VTMSLTDAPRSKSRPRKGVWVQVPPSVLVSLYQNRDRLSRLFPGNLEVGPRGSEARRLTSSSSGLTSGGVQTPHRLGRPLPIATRARLHPGSDGAGLRPRSRFARFTNLPELQQMFRAFSDVQTAEMLDLPRPCLEGGKRIVVACPMSEEQHALQQELVERYERLRSQKVDPREDNALAITTDGRKLATDARMLSARAPDSPGSKVNQLVENVAAIWNRTAPTRGTQMIFCDMGVNPTPWGYSLYEEIITKLVTHGIPRERIAAIGDAESDAKKQALFEKVRNGSVRVLIGSTQKSRKHLRPRRFLHE